MNTRFNLMFTSGMFEKLVYRKLSVSMPAGSAYNFAYSQGFRNFLDVYMLINQSTVGLVSSSTRHCMCTLQFLPSVTTLFCLISVGGNFM